MAGAFENKNIYTNKEYQTNSLTSTYKNWHISPPCVCHYYENISFTSRNHVYRPPDLSNQVQHIHCFHKPDMTLNCQHTTDYRCFCQVEIQFTCLGSAASSSEIVFACCITSLGLSFTWIFSCVLVTD